MNKLDSHNPQIDYEEASCVTTDNGGCNNSVHGATAGNKSPNINKYKDASIRSDENVNDQMSISNDPQIQGSNLKCDTKEITSNQNISYDKTETENVKGGLNQENCTEQSKVENANQEDNNFETEINYICKGSNKIDKCSGNSIVTHVKCTQTYEHQDDSDSLPIGLQNPQAYCYLNSILQIMFSCTDFQIEMINFYKRYSVNEENADKKFVFVLAKLFYFMNTQERCEVQNAVKDLQRYFGNSIHGDDIHKCYLQILSKITLAFKCSENTPLTNVGTSKDDAEKKYLFYKSQNKGFIFDLFCGQISFRTMCESCEKVYFEKFQLFKSMPLQVPLSNWKIPIERCILNFFEKSKIIDGDFKCCDTQDIISVSQFTHVPKYIFIYLVRGAYNSYENKNNTFILFDRYIDIPTIHGNVIYKLHSVIDHLGGNESGHYYVKTLSGSSWWLKNDFQVRKMLKWSEIPTTYSIGLLIEKCNNWDIPELLNDPGHNYINQNALNSIVQMLYLCGDFRKLLIDFYLSNNTENFFFKKKLGEIMYYLEKQEIGRAQILMKEYLLNTKVMKRKNCINQLYIDILNEINSEGKNGDSTSQQNNTNDDLVNFLVIVFMKTYCKTCGELLCEKPENFMSVYLRIDKNIISLSKGIEKHFKNSEIRNKDNIPNHNHEEIIQNQEIILAPKYLFFYLDYEYDYRNNIDIDDEVSLPTKSKSQIYSLVSVLNCIRISKTEKLYFAGSKSNQNSNLVIYKVVAVIMERKDDDNKKDLENKGNCNSQLNNNESENNDNKNEMENKANGNSEQNKHDSQNNDNENEMENKENYYSQSNNDELQNNDNKNEMENKENCNSQINNNQSQNNDDKKDIENKGNCYSHSNNDELQNNDNKNEMENKGNGNSEQNKHKSQNNDNENEMKNEGNDSSQDGDKYKGENEEIGNSQHENFNDVTKMKENESLVIFVASSKTILYETTLINETLESCLLAESVKKIIALKKGNIFYAVFGLLFTCTPFRNFMLEIHKNDVIAKMDMNYKHDEFVRSAVFVNDICTLFVHLIEEKGTQSFFNSLEVYLMTLNKEFRLTECFNFILEKINLITKETVVEKNLTNDVSDTFLECLKCQNQGFACDLFDVQLMERVCNNCSKTEKSHQHFYSFHMEIPGNETNVNLQKCILNYLSYQTDSSCKYCRNPKISSMRKINHSPQYLLICLDQLTKLNDQDKRVYVEYDEILIIDTTIEQVIYSLCAVINEDYHIKFLTRHDWWQTTSFRSELITANVYYSSLNSGFLFKKVCVDSNE